MQTKLTLRMDDALVRAAKKRAAQQGVSVSRMVADFFAQIAAAEDGTQLSAWTEGLVGLACATPDTPPLTDDQAREQVLDALAEKHS